MENAVVGVRFQEAGKIYYFEPGGYEKELTVGSYVVVETSRGIELGRVVIAPGQVLKTELTEPLKPILRPATPEDIARAERWREKAVEATALARERARALGLPMKIVTAQYTLDGSRLTVYFTAEGRVDFRELIRDLAGKVHAQVQLRQVGPRDQAKVIGGYGRCGRRLCCTSWLTAFPAISIKMAKEQNLPLNPAKISGQCGRLLCCLAYENDLYKKLKSELPKPESLVSTPAGTARVLAVNAVKQVVTLEMIDGRQVIEATIEQLGFARGVTRPLDIDEAAEEGEEVLVLEREEYRMTSVTVTREEQRRPTRAGEHGREGQHARNESRSQPTGSTAPKSAAGEESAAPASRKRRRRRRRGKPAGG
jgi:cell fate regulator YaaT (PSP1 superfamily)